MTEYFIHDGVKEIGPFTLIQLSSQKIHAETPVWHKGLAGWVKASDLSELEPLLALKISPPPFKRPNNTRRQKYVFLVWIAAGIFVITAFLIWFFSAGNTSSTLPDQAKKVSSTAAPGKEQIENQRLIREAEARKQNYRNNWNRYIWVSPNKYKQNLLGGISDLQVGIENETDYVLDEVNVLVHYIKSNGATYKIEPVEIYAVPAHGKAFIPAPASNRGTSVVLEINAISSRKMNFCYSADIDIRRNKDPYRCKTN